MSNEWKMVRLGDCTTITMGQSPESSSYNTENDGLPFYQGNADFGILNPAVRYYCNKPSKFAYCNDVLMSVRAPVGALNIANGDCCIGRGLCSISEKAGVSFYKYIFYNLLHNQSYIQSLGVGSTFKAISGKIVSNLSIPLPSVERQREIAGVLDKTSELVEKRKAQLKELDRLAESIFYDMFGDPVTNPKGWGICKVIEKTKCIVPGRDKPKSFTGDIPWITTADLNHLGYTSKANLFLSKDEIAEVKAKIIPKDSVIMTCVGDLGVVSIAENKMIINQQLHAFICDDVNNIFLAYNLSQRKDFMCKMASSTTVPYMNKTICNSIPIMLPPLSLQQQFAERIEKIEEQKQKVKTALEESENLFQRLMQDLFNPKAKS